MLCLFTQAESVLIPTVFAYSLRSLAHPFASLADSPNLLHSFQSMEIIIKLAQDSKMLSEIQEIGCLDDIQQGKLADLAT